MNPLIVRHRQAIESLCHRHRVLSLHLFGSSVAVEPGREPQDIDLLVSFEPMQPGELADAYLGLLEELERLLGMSVDLVMDRAITNPHFRAAVDQSKVILYAAA